VLWDTTPRSRVDIYLIFSETLVTWFHNRRRHTLEKPLFIFTNLLSLDWEGPIFRDGFVFQSNNITIARLFLVRNSVTSTEIWLFYVYLTLSDSTSDLVRQYDFPVFLLCRKTSDTVFVVFVCPLSEPVRRFSACSTDFSQQIAQVVLFLFLHVFLF
jgi:hypothetical protein